MGNLYVYDGWKGCFADAACIDIYVRYLLGEVALLISVLYSNRYVVFVVTFVCSQFMWMILPPGINMFYLFRADFSRETMHIYTPYLIECVYILMVCVVTYILIKKRLKV